MLKQDTIPKGGVFALFLLATMLLKQLAPQEVETYINSDMRHNHFVSIR